MIVYLNGQFLSDSEAGLVPFDRGFLYGDGVFETLRAYSGRPFRLRPHLRRLQRGLESLEIACPELSELEWIIHEVITKNSLKEAYIRLTVTRGICQRGPIPKDCEGPTVFCYGEPFRALPERLYRQGVRIGLSRRPQWRLPEEAHLKAISFLPNILERMNTGGDEFDKLLLSPDGFISETTVCNIFFLRNDTLFTPSLECAPLAGITREVVMELARGMGIRVVEGMFRPSELQDAEEAFLTNTLIEVLPVREFMGRSFRIDRTREIIRAYKEAVARETSNPYPGKQPEGDENTTQRQCPA